MKLNLTLDEAKARARDYLRRDVHCGTTVIEVMREAYGLGDEDLSWAVAALWGGIAGQQRATCGALAAAVVCLGLRYRCPSCGPEKAEALHDLICDSARELTDTFLDEYGTTSCLEITGEELIDDEAVRKSKESGALGTLCPVLVGFIIGQLYAIETKTPGDT